VILTPTRDEQAAWTRRFCAERRIGSGDGILDTVLVGNGETVATRIIEYAAAGATDLMLGFADFPATTMLERFAREVTPRIAATPAPEDTAPPSNADNLPSMAPPIPEG
jgi:alkanesulfonate monooxygenase SsuD/methylene tetrahydromethanopterin reductase-like flavin-dependent oxidoreductase (luciferase family)